MRLKSSNQVKHKMCSNWRKVRRAASMSPGSDALDHECKSKMKSNLKLKFIKEERNLIVVVACVAFVCFVFGLNFVSAWMSFFVFSIGISG